MKRVADTLLSRRTVLRMPRADDLSTYTTYCTSDRARFVGGPFSENAAFDKFAAMIGHWTLRGFGRWVIEFNGHPVGHVGPMRGAKAYAPDLTWTLWSAGHEGKGLASEAAATAARHLLVDCAWPLLLIRIHTDNIASIRVAERLGAEPINDPTPADFPGAATFRLTGVTV